MNEEEELLKRAAEERANIVSRYARGREGAEIDPWEDPAYEIYHVTDRYGFIHDKRLSQKADPHELRLKQIEMERVKKWLKMLSAWNSTSTTDKLKRRIYKGIPDSLRGKVWAKLLDLDGAKLKEKFGKYEEMRQLAWKWSPEIRQIDLDVNRTYRDHIMFRERYSLQQRALFNVLAAYSVYNLEVGYCQGMSQIAALLLMYMSEEDAFWALTILLADKRYGMHGFYIPGFPKLIRFQVHHDKIMNKFLPKLKQHLDRNNVDTGIYTLKWFFQCFLDRIPFSLTLRVWDIYLLEGDRVLTAMAYTLLKMHGRTIARLSMDDIMHFIQVKLEKDYGFDDDLAISTLERSMDQLRRAKLDTAGPPGESELPSQPFGVFKDPSFERKVGRRSAEFSAAERTTRESVKMRRDAAQAAAAEANLTSPTTANGGQIAQQQHLQHPQQRDSRTSGSDTTGLGGSKFSFDPNVDDASSLLDCQHGGSRRSLADTSVTSTADLSVFSTTTRSQALDNSLDTHSNASDASSGGSGVLPRLGGVNAASTAVAAAVAAAAAARAHAPTPDVVRIYVPYTSGASGSTSPTPTPSPQNGEPPGRPLSRPDHNKIRIRIDATSQERLDEQTPVVDSPKPFRVESPEVDLK